MLQMYILLTLTRSGHLLGNYFTGMYQLILNEKRSRVRSLPDLPPFPVIGQQIMSQVTSEQVDIPRLSKTIEQDPAVFSRIIGVANSAYYGCPDKIYTINRAIVRVLGLSVVKSLALGIVLNEPFKHSLCHGFDMKQYWLRSMFIAMTARWLGRRIEQTEKDFLDQAYLAGMLNNLGELVLVHLFPSEMNDVYMRHAGQSEVDIAMLQEEIIGITSQEASTILAKKWHLPESLLIVFEHANDADYAGTHKQLLQLISLCKLIADEEDLNVLLENADILAAAAKLGLESQQLAKLLEKIPAIHHDVEDLATVLARE